MSQKSRPVTYKTAKTPSPNRKSRGKKTKKIPPKPLDEDIPKEVFDEVMAILNDERDFCEHYFKPRCSVPIHNITVTHRNCFTKPQHKLMEEARLSLMQRDWVSMAQIMTMLTPNAKDHILFFQVVVRYAAIFIAHHQDKKYEQMRDMFLKGVVGCQFEDEEDLFYRSLTHD